MASAVTPTLYIKTKIPLKFDHLETTSPEEAAIAIDQGKTVLVSDEHVAYRTLKLLGLSSEEACLRVEIARRGPKAVGAVDPIHPVPQAPSEDGPVPAQQPLGDVLRG